MDLLRLLSASLFVSIWQLWYANFMGKQQNDILSYSQLLNIYIFWQLFYFCVCKAIKTIFCVEAAFVICGKTW